MHDPSALNYDPAATIDVLPCEFPIPGCTEETACNYDATATQDDGSCQYVDECGVCGGDGIPEGACDCDGNILDCAGVCGGDNTCFVCPEGYVLDCDGSGECHPAIWIGDGYCDGPDQQWGANLLCYDNDGGDCSSGDYPGAGCTNPEACNYDETALYADGSCIFPEFGDDCDELEAVGCTDPTACNYDATATEPGACSYPDECGICGGDGIPAGDCDCEGNQLDALGECGGPCEADADADGICDVVDPCVGELDACSVCNGPGAIYECGCADILKETATATETSLTSAAYVEVTEALVQRHRAPKPPVTFLQIQ